MPAQNQPTPENETAINGRLVLLYKMLGALEKAAGRGAVAAIAATAVARWDLLMVGGMSVARLGATIEALATAIRIAFPPDVLANPNRLTSFLRKIDPVVGCLIGIKLGVRFHPTTAEAIFLAALVGGEIGERAVDLVHSGSRAAAVTLARFTQNQENNGFLALTNRRDSDVNQRGLVARRAR
jgi:hypothetical protein